MLPIYRSECRDGGRRTIHVEITNACNLECSNCTRFVGHHKKPFFMDVDTFKKAVKSLEYFPGVVGIMGGEPTLHPQFEELMDIYMDIIPQINRRALWTNGFKYDKFKSKIEEVFAKEMVIYNDHNPSVPDYHQPLLVASKDVVPDYEERKKLIDNCWVQRRWSASITPKGAFFCEVAAAQDHLFNGPGGWELTDDWWDKRPEEFQDQVEQYCHNCSACIPMNKVSAYDGYDYASPSNIEKLKDINTPRYAKGVVLEIGEELLCSSYEDATNVKPWEHRGLKARQWASGEIVQDEVTPNEQCSSCPTASVNESD